MRTLRNSVPAAPASRAVGIMLDVCFGSDKPAVATEEAAEEQPETPRRKGPSKQRAIEKKLQQPVSVDFTNTPLRRVLDDLRGVQNINIYVDEPALAEKGVSVDSPITVRLEKIAFKSALNLILHSVHLTYIVEDEVLRITTEEHACGEYKQPVYIIGDLYDTAPEPKQKGCQDPKTPSTTAEPGVEQQVGGLMKACHLLMNEGLHEQAAELARQAFALDPERVMADPLVYKMHLLAEMPAKQPAGSSEASEPPSCPYCPTIGKPIPGIVPQKKTPKSGPTTLLVPAIPAVDYEVVPALDRVLTEPTAGAEEASEDDAPSSLQELIETITGPGHTLFGLGVNADGGMRLCGECPCGDSVYHVLYSRGCLAIWKTPDAAKTKP